MKLKNRFYKSQIQKSQIPNNNKEWASKFRFGIWNLLFLILFTSCGIYSFSGANVEGKTIKLNLIENNAGIVVPSLSQTLTNKIRSKILNQTGLTSITNGNTDYEISGNITGYTVSVAELQNTDVASKNRLTITVEVDFKNNLNTKNNYVKSFSRFANFDSNKNLQSVENTLIAEITEQIADDIFNASFVNW